MFNLLPGQGLGFTQSKLMAFGLGYITGEYVAPDPDSSGGGGIVYDSGYYTLLKLKKDDEEITEIISAICEVIS